MGLIEPNKYFLTQAEIQSNKSFETTVTVIEADFDSYQVNTTATEMIISKNNYLFINDKYKGPNVLKKSWAWLTGKHLPDIESSVLRGKKIKIETSLQMPVIMDGEIVAKTPIVTTLQPKVLKIITKPVRIEE